ncbi:hypothetical protein BH11MYX2_BH11MYX2_04040 [soil metagenome]
MGRRLVRALTLSIAATSVWVVLFSAGAAHAQSAEAEALFTEGDKLLKAGNIAPACDAFDASNRIEARAGTLIRLGECRERNRQLASAWSAYKDALTRVKDPAKRAIATTKVAELEPKLSYFTLVVAPASQVEGLTVLRDGKPFDTALWNRALPLDGGDYAITVRAPGREEWTTTVTVPVDHGKVTVDVPKLAPPTVVGAQPPLQPSPQSPPSGEGDEVSAGTWSGKRKVAIVAAGVGGLAIVTGIVLGTQAKGKQDDAHALCADTQTPCADADRANSLIDSGQKRALGANIAFGVGAVAVVAAGVLWFTGAPETSSHGVALTPTFTPGEAGVAVFGRF